MRCSRTWTAPPLCSLVHAGACTDNEELLLEREKNPRRTDTFAL